MMVKKFRKLTKDLGYGVDINTVHVIFDLPLELGKRCLLTEVKICAKYFQILTWGSGDMEQTHLLYM